MLRKQVCILAFLAAGSGSLSAVEVGDGYEKVVAEKGAPQGKIETGGATVLNYPDATVKLRDGKVVSVTPTTAEKAASNITVQPAPPRPTARANPGNQKTTAKMGVNAGEWTTHYDAAVEQARAENKKIFLFFTGSDWCGWCKKFDREILSTSEFKSYAQENLILVKLDFPKKTLQETEEKEANKKLLHQYAVRGFPTVIILSSSGAQVGHLGYMPGGPDPFLKELGKF